jgi:NHLM bacteriocin system ABC transporter ATP-binding protein
MSAPTVGAAPDAAAAIGRSAFSPFWTDRAQRVSFRDEQVVSLNQVDSLLLIELGALDLFAVQRRAEGPQGRWRFLCRVEAGTLLMGFPPGPKHRLVGRPVPGTVVSTVPASILSQLSATTIAQGDDRSWAQSAVQLAVAIEELAHGLDTALTALARALRDELPPRVFLPLESNVELTTEAGGVLRSVDGVHWARVLEGTLGVGGSTGLANMATGEVVAATETDWLVAQEPARVKSESTIDLLAHGGLDAAVTKHAARFLFDVDRRVERIEARDSEAIEQRQALDERHLSEALYGFSRVLRDDRSLVTLADLSGESPAIAAAKLVGERLGIKITAPRSGARVGRRTDIVSQIAAASGVRSRTIRLPERWWQKDLGPLIGYRKADQQPVALLPQGRGYRMILLDEEAVVTVGKAEAANLTRQATTLYPTMGSGEITGRSLIRLGLQGASSDVAALIATAVLVGALGLLVPIVTGAVLGTYVARAERPLVISGSMLLVASAIIAGALSVVQNLAVLRIEGRADAGIQSAIWDRVLSLPTKFFSEYTAGELGTAALGVNAIRETLSGLATQAALAAVSSLLYLILLYVYDVPLALVATALLLVGASACVLAGVFEVRRQRALAFVEHRLASKTLQLLVGLPKLRVAAAEDRAFSQWASDFTEARELSLSARRVQNTITTFNAGFPLVCSLIFFALVGGSIGRHVSTTTFLGFFMAFTLMVAAMLRLTGVVITALSIVPMFEHLRPILTAEPESRAEAADPGELTGEIDFSHVSFRYRGDAPLVLDDVSFRVRPGEFVALVGPTGCGKSTILRLLLGFETPESGSVLYDGQSLEQVDITAVRRQCGVVLQNGALLAGDIRTNILGNSNYTVDDAWEAAKMAGVDHDIAAMPMGMQTMLPDGANTLSGGQRQRIMIARALVSRPRILFFDEATSALDNPTQEVVANSTRRLNATRLVIAHRLSSLRGADRIIALDAGRIVQEGSYEELMSDESGLFYRLARRQKI